MPKYIALAVTLALAGCGEYDRTEAPLRICHERDVQSGQCTKSEYVCTAPLRLTKRWGGLACTSMGDKEQ